MMHIETKTPEGRATPPYRYGKEKFAGPILTPRQVLIAHALLRTAAQPRAKVRLVIEER